MRKTPRWLTAVVRATEDDTPPLPYTRGERPPLEVRRELEEEPQYKLAKA